MEASTLIYLAKADAFDLLPACGGPFAVAPAVWRESVEAGERRGAPEVVRITRARDAGLIETAVLTTRVARRARELRTAHALGQGESETLALASPSGHLVLDEGRATRVAESLGLVPVPTILLPLIAARGGRVSAARARAWLERLAVVTGTRVEVLLRLGRALRGEV